MQINSTEIIKRLEREGWKHVRTSGSHYQFKHPQKKGTVTIPHPRKNIPTGTLKSIYKQAGWQ